MTEIRKLTSGDKSPGDEDHVLIEKTEVGSYAANGLVSVAGGAILWAPPVFMSRESALSAARRWASSNGIPTIYVRDGDLFPIDNEVKSAPAKRSARLS